MLLARLYCSRLECFISPAQSGEGGDSSPEMPQVLRSSKKLQNGCFSKLFVRVSGWGSACVSSLAHSGDGGESSPEMLKTLQSSRKLQKDCFFSKLFVRGSGCEFLGCSGALISVFSSHT